MGECDISEDDLLYVTAKKQTKFEIAKDLISTMLAEGDQQSNKIFDACLNAGVNVSMMQHVKRQLGIKSIRKIDDWYWTLSREPEYPEGGIDEMPFKFLDELADTKSNDLMQLPEDIIPIKWRECV